MARPSKWSDREWAEASRLLAGGMSYSEVAKKTGISKPSLVGRFSDRLETIKDVANRLATAETDLSVLPITDQVSVRILADQLKGISNHLASAAHSSAQVASRLASIAMKRSEGINENSDSEDLKPVVALVETANRAGTLGMGLLAANKGKGTDGTPTLEDLVTGRKA